MINNKMKAKWERDRQRREKVKEGEGRRKALKGLVRSEMVSEEVRRKAEKELAMGMARDSGANRVRNRCILSGRGRGVGRHMRVSRINLFYAICHIS
jgi:small subunit ribosomal protein S14